MLKQPQSSTNLHTKFRKNILNVLQGLLKLLLSKLFKVETFRKALRLMPSKFLLDKKLDIHTIKFQNHHWFEHAIFTIDFARLRG